MGLAFVITTINPPTQGIRRIAEACASTDDRLIVAGDLKTAEPWHCEPAVFLSHAAQRDSGFALASVLPSNIYGRKMIGYLHAVREGAEWIRETDDDNLPYEEFFERPVEYVEGRVPVPVEGWVNPCAHFTERAIWPRGFPLPLVHPSLERRSASSFGMVRGCVVTQGLADGDPDVDAIYRLTSSDTSEVRFRRDAPLLIPPASWAPFNSQVTTWPVSLLPLMYLPATCSFRMTDIWRSFIALRIMRECGAHLVYTQPQVFQERNAHVLMRDFADEVDGYLGYQRFVSLLDATPIRGGIAHLADDVRDLYRVLVEAEFFAEGELIILDAWLLDVAELSEARRA